MKAIRYRRPGPAAEVLELVDMPCPEPARGEVRVRVHASGVNPHDTKTRSGWACVPIPGDGITPHSDGAGVIEAVGADIGTERIGQRVWVAGARRQGTAAEQVCIAASHAIALPDTFCFAEGACLGVPGITAWLAILADGPVTGQTILIHGGGGAVGRMAVELATRSGARVIATGGSPKSRDVARSKGARIVLDRHADDVAASVLEATDGHGAARIVDVDFAANQEADIRALALHGTLAAYSSSSDRRPVLDYYAFARKSARLDFVQGALLNERQLAGATACLAALTSKGLLRPDIATELPMADTATAHEMVEQGAPANVVVVPVPPDT